MDDPGAADTDTSRWLGPALVLTSAVLFSLSGVLTKAIEADTWSILTWRGLVGAVGIATYVLVRPPSTGTPTTPRLGRLRLGPTGWAIATVGAVGSITFIGAFKNTLVANVSVVYATIPFVAAALERLVLGTAIRRRTFGAATASLVGVVVIVAGSLGTPNLRGDALAVAMVVLNAAYMVLIRANPGTDTVLAGAAGGLQLFAVGWFATDPLDLDRDDALLIIAFGLVFAAATVFWIEGTRLVTAAESGLFGSAETPVAIGLAWLLLAEIPPRASVIGAAIVAAAVALHLRADLRAAEP